MRDPWRVLSLFIVAAALCSAARAHAEPIALVNGQVVDVERRIVLTDHTVLIDQGRIVDVGPSRSIKIPRDTESVDCRGKWILPGLVDAHIHLFQSGGLYTRPDAIDLRRFRPYEEEREWVRENAGDFLARYLAAGITTVIDVGGPLSNYALRDRFNVDSRSPTIHLTGPLISTRQPAVFESLDDAPILQADTPEQAREQVRQQLPHRPDFIKIWYIVRADLPAEKALPLIEATLDEAHRHGLKVAVHATQLNTAKLAVRAGADILVHGVEDAPIDKELLTLLKRKRVPYIPTLLVSRGYDQALSGRFMPSSHDLALGNPHAIGTLEDVKHLISHHGFALPERKPSSTHARQLRLQNLKAVHDARVLVATGTDAGNIGTLHASSYIAEVVEMQAAGLDAWDILEAATLNGAKVLGNERSTGSVARGKRADLVVLDQNPLQDLRHLKSVHRVVNRGTVLDPDELVDQSPVALVQRQLNGYNARDIDAFMEPYAEDVQVYTYPGRFEYAGKVGMRERYAARFQQTPELHCEVVERIVLGNTVIDQERVTGLPGGTMRAVAIYTIEKARISRVEFVRAP